MTIHSSLSERSERSLLTEKTNDERSEERAYVATVTAAKGAEGYAE